MVISPGLSSVLQRCRVCSFIISIAVPLYWTLSVGAAADGGVEAASKRIGRPVTVVDTIRMTKLGDRRYWWGNPALDRVARFSPDGSKFLVIVRRGDIEQNTNIYSLLLWNTSEALRSSSPKLLLSMASSSNRPAIEEVTWLGAGEGFTFLGEGPGESHQLYAYDLGTDTVTQLTHHATNIREYSITADGRSIAYVADEESSLWNAESTRHGVVASNQPLADLVLGRKDSESGDSALYFRSGSDRSRRMSVLGQLPHWYATPFLSPNGRFIAIAAYPSQLPESWNDYSIAAIQLKNREQLSERYTLVDTATGNSEVLLDAPTLSSGSLAWSPDSTAVAISGTLLPLRDTVGAERELRRSHIYSVVVNAPSGEFEKIGDDDLKLVRWDAASGQVLFEAGQRPTTSGSATLVLYGKQGDKWVRREQVSTETAPLEVNLEEDLNTPPRIVAHDKLQHRDVVLLELNPNFKNLTFAKIEPVTWRGSDGHDVKGGLYYPVDYVAGRKYPLVIQTHGWDPKRFWIDGPYTTAFAAQALAGHNMFVLQVDETWYGPDFNTAGEVKREVATFEGAIDYLDHLGLIDRNRVGIIGFSRTCLFVKYALIHSNYRFAAATVTDGVDGGYFQYLVTVTVNPGWARDFYEGINGGPPYGDGMTSWIRNNSTFNVDRLQTPVLVTALNPESLLLEWEWFAVAQRLAKPVELIYMQDGQHALERPWERVISQQGNVDWFDFWLNGYEDPDQAKAEQYARWRKLRVLQKSQGVQGERETR